MRSEKKCLMTKLDSKEHISIHTYVYIHTYEINKYLVLQDC